MTKLRRRTKGDEGISIVMMAIAISALIAIAGLVLDGGNAYTTRRQMQNAADSSAMAGARAFDKWLINQTPTNMLAIYTQARAAALSNGSLDANFDCDLVDASKTAVMSCPQDGTATIPVSVVGVRTFAGTTEQTFFMGAVGADSFTANATAVAQVGKPAGANAPFMVCATAPGNIPNLLLPDGSSPTGWVVNNAAISTNGTTPEYHLYGNDIKDDGRDCGNGSSSFRGLIDNDAGPYSIPGWWDGLTGNKNGPTLAMVRSGSVCSGDFDTFIVGCVLVLPLCDHGNGQTGNNFEAYCVDVGLFKVTHVSNHDIRGVFLGRATITQAAALSGVRPDANGARVISLTE